jgi:hypothetical protein
MNDSTKTSVRGEFREAVTFETKCWERDWEFILKTPYLSEQISRNEYDFAERLLFINNVHDPVQVAKHADRLVATGTLTGYQVVETYADEALAFFRLSRSMLGRGYVYSVAELVSIYLCKTPYLLHFAGDVILERPAHWVTDALDGLASNLAAVVANPTWNHCFEEAADEAQ